MAIEYLVDGTGEIRGWRRGDDVYFFFSVATLKYVGAYTRAVFDMLTMGSLQAAMQAAMHAAEVVWEIMPASLRCAKTRYHPTDGRMVALASGLSDLPEVQREMHRRAGGITVEKYPIGASPPVTAELLADDGAFDVRDENGQPIVSKESWSDPKRGATIVGFAMQDAEEGEYVEVATVGASGQVVVGGSPTCVRCGRSHLAMSLQLEDGTVCSDCWSGVDRG